MSAIDTDRFRDLLLDHRSQVANAIEHFRREHEGSLEEETDEIPSDNHMADVATDTFDRELDFSLEESSEHVLHSIDEALGRIADGTYGLCQSCGSPIAEERLEAIPYARLCIECKRREER
jgi:RNA polymerase-binding protein DksA